MIKFSKDYIGKKIKKNKNNQAELDMWPILKAFFSPTLSLFFPRCHSSLSSLPLSRQEMAMAV